MSASSALGKAATAVRVKIFSDVVWPFCFLGLRHLQEASKQSGIPIELTWEPFLLNPHLPDEGEDLKSHIYHKYGSRGLEMLDNPNSYLKTAGEKVGIQFISERNIYPTQKAHMLMEYLKETDQNETANRVMAKMYKQYFEQGHNINDIQVLTDICRQSGVDVTAVQEALLDDKYRKQVADKDHLYKREMGISGVPFYLIQRQNGKQAPISFSGAQPIEIIAEQLEKATQE